jgi:hypothetical protein
MKPILTLVAAAVCSLLSGCITTSYSVEMRRVGDHYERRTTIVGSETAPATVTKGAAPRIPAKSGAPSDPKVVTTQLESRTPDDVGGAGSITMFPTSLGTLTCYLERFRGDDDISGALQKTEASCDRLAEFVTLWLQTELGQEPGWPKLLAFCGNGLRRDLKNIFLLLQLDDGARTPDTNGAFTGSYARAIAYLIEHGYVTPEQSPRLAYIATHFEACEQEGMAMIRRLIASKMDTDPASPAPGWAFLQTSEAMHRSFDRWAKSTEAYKKGREEAIASGSPEPSAEAALEGAFPQTLWLRLFGEPLTITLAAPERPVYTNGRWDSTSLLISWRATLPHRNETEPATPFIAHAVWAEPDQAFQQSHFGGVYLRDAALAEYCFWRRGLDDANGAQWDAYIATLSPGVSVSDFAKGRGQPEPRFAGADDGLKVIRDAINGATAAAGREKPLPK